MLLHIGHVDRTAGENAKRQTDTELLKETTFILLISIPVPILLLFTLPWIVGGYWEYIRRKMGNSEED